MTAQAYRPLILATDAEARDLIARPLVNALDAPIDFVSVHVGADGYPFPRNLAAEGPGGTMLMSAPETLRNLQSDEALAISAREMAAVLARFHVKVNALPFPVNWANLASDPGLDLLVLAQPQTVDQGPSWQYPARGHESENEQLIDAFGRPGHVMKIAPAKIRPTLTTRVNDMCYDLDMYLSLFRNVDGEAVALVHSKCIEKNPPAGLVGRADFTRALKALGVHVVEMSSDDFQRRAANSISDEPGSIVFSEPVSTALKQQLSKLGVKSREMEGFANGREFGIHCATLELPEPGRGTLGPPAVRPAPPKAQSGDKKSTASKNRAGEL